AHVLDSLCQMCMCCIGHLTVFNLFPTRRSSDLDDAAGIDLVDTASLGEQVDGPGGGADVVVDRQVAGRDFDDDCTGRGDDVGLRSEEHTSELQSRENLVCRLLLEKKKSGACIVV